MKVARFNPKKKPWPDGVYQDLAVSPRCDIRCDDCMQAWGVHGRVMMKHGEVAVCPGDWVIHDEDGIHVLTPKELLCDE